MTTLEELLTMMAEDAAKTVPPEKRPPPLPPKKAEAIGPEEIESLDDGPVLTGERLWPAALPRSARRGPPPPPPGRRARGTAAGVAPEQVTSGLIDVRSMAMAYERERAAAAAAAAPPPPPEDIIRVELPVVAPPAVEPKVAEPPPAEPEAAPTPVMAEGTRPFPAVEDTEAEPEAEPVAEVAVEAAPETDREKRAALWPVVARRAALVLAVGGVAALAVNFVINRTRSQAGAAEPTDYSARVALPEPVAAVPAVTAPAPVEVAVPVEDPVAVEPTVIVQPTTITEVAEAPAEAPVEAIAPPVAEVAQPALADGDQDQAAVDKRPAPGEPPPELLADGCFDAACATTAPRARRPARPAAEIVTMPARLPTRPSGSEIASAIFSAQDQIDGCGAVYGSSGAVPLKIKIAPNGAITSVAVGEGTTRFRTCVADIVRRVRMPASVIGTSASFPVLIR